MTQDNRSALEMKQVRAFVAAHSAVNMEKVKGISDIEVEDRAIEILVDAKRHWDIEGAPEVEVIKLIRRELLRAIFSSGLEIRLSSGVSSSRFDGPLTSNF